MPNKDGTGPMGQGPRSGGGWGVCDPIPGEGRGAGRGAGGGAGGRGGRGGHGYRNQYYATGLTGRQRAAQANIAPAPDVAAAVPADQLERIEEKLGQVLTRLDDLEAKGTT